MSDKIIVREKIYVPEDMVDVDSIKKKYTKYIYEQSACKVCPYLIDRHSYNCEICPAYKGVVKLFTKKQIKGTTHIGLPIGDKSNFEAVTGLLFKDLLIEDKRTNVPFNYDIKFLIPLRDYQEPLVESFLSKKYGLIEAPPRSGKTAVMLKCFIDLGQRALMLANQHEFVEQFLDHIRGNEKEGIPKCTNLPELEEKHKKKLYGAPKTDEDYNNFQIFAMTYQQFITEKNGKNRLKKIFPHVGTLGVDEVHRSNAKTFAKVVSSFPARYKMGVSGTIERKDHLEFIAKAIIGPVVAKSTRESLIPTIYIHETEAKPKQSYNGARAWVYAMQFLANNKKRNEQIVERVIKDLKNGHNIVIPVTFKKHVHTLCDMINEAYGEKICEMFVGGNSSKNKEHRKEILSRAKQNKTRVIVGIRSLLQLGLNVPTWSCIYEIMPISNKPNLKQETSRVRTPCDTKNDPIIRLFVDFELGQSAGCAKSSLSHMKEFGYRFATSEKQKSLTRKVFDHGRKRSLNSDDYTPFRTLREK